jgi:hypothetical protein
MQRDCRIHALAGDSEADSKGTSTLEFCSTAMSWHIRVKVYLSAVSPDRIRG